MQLPPQKRIKDKKLSKKRYFLSVFVSVIFTSPYVAFLLKIAQ